MNSLPDPRTYAAPGGDSLALLAIAAATAGSALQQTAPGRALIQAVSAALAEGRDSTVRDSLARAGSAAARMAMERAIEFAALAPAEDVGLRAFAFPLLLVTGGKSPGKIPGAIPDVGELRDLLEVSGALGQARNVGIGNALVSAGALERVPLAGLHALGRSASDAPVSMHLAPADIELDAEEERVHLRFLVGAAVTPRDAPDVCETAANVGAWGMSWTRALAKQLGQPGLSLLPVPRPPMPIRRALAAGRFAWQETQYQLFLSKALRDFRARIGDPDARVAAFSDASVRILLSTPIDEALVARFRWPLEPADDLGAVTAGILDLLEECRIANIDVVSSVQPAPASH